MNFSKFSAAILASSMALGASTASADLLDVHMSIPKDLTFLADSAKLMDKSLRDMSGGDVGLNLFGSGELIPAGEILESVSSGAVPAGWSFLGQWGGQVPVSAQLAASWPKSTRTVKISLGQMTQKYLAKNILGPYRPLQPRTAPYRENFETP